MKFSSRLIVLLALISHIQTYSQKLSSFQYALFKKRHPFQVTDLNASQKDGKTIWTAKATLSNRSNDTLFMFSTSCSEQANYAIDTMALFIDFKKCEADKQIIIAIPPNGHRTVDLEIKSHKPLTSSIEFKIFIFIYKVKKLNDSVPISDSPRNNKGLIILASNKLKT